MSAHKASRFNKLAQQNGWETKWRQRENWAFAEVVATRGAESITISWENNQLNGPPIYRFHDMERKLHSRLVAERKLAAPKPDLDQYKRHQRSAAVASRGTGDPSATSNGLAEQEYDLPFDPDADPDSVILKAVRGNVLVWRSSVSGVVESCLVPWRIQDQGKVRVMNTDTKNVFFLASSSSGQDYLSFMDSEGRFRAVRLKSIMGVV